MCEILAPAGDEKRAIAAINAGTDAVYLGLKQFSARSSAENFDWESLESIIKYAHAFDVKVYVAMNTLVKDREQCLPLSPEKMRKVKLIQITNEKLPAGGLLPEIELFKSLLEKEGFEVSYFKDGRFPGEDCSLEK